MMSSGLASEGVTRWAPSAARHVAVWKPVMELAVCTVQQYALLQQKLHAEVYVRHA